METIDKTKQCIERNQTRIKIIREESKLLTASIDRMFAQRKKLSEEKRQLKKEIQALSAEIETAQNLTA